MNSFNKLLIQISKDITSRDLNELKFACDYFIPAGRAESIVQPIQLFSEMKRQNKLSENNKEILADLLADIGRVDLQMKLLKIHD